MALTMLSKKDFVKEKSAGKFNSTHHDTTPIFYG
jgi:hypothetical protein